MKEVTFPIRVFKYLNVHALLIASAVGGIHEDYEAGDVPLLTTTSTYTIIIHFKDPMMKDLAQDFLI